jgi:ABC-2 type transport system permease protein
MATAESSLDEFLWQVRVALVVAKKNVMVYYLKPPVLTFGVIFPLFFYLAFAAGHQAPIEIMVPGIVAMALFFTASAVGPLVTPWERQAKTYERLVTSPASLSAILSGDVLAGMAFGVILSLVPLAATLALTSAQIAHPPALLAGLLLGALAFSGLGVLLAAPATEGPSQVMMLSNLVRLPLIFVSGVFVPLAEMPAWGQWLSPLSPLSYCADLVRVGFGGKHYFSLTLDMSALLGFTAAFIIVAHFFHRKTRDRVI